MRPAAALDKGLAASEQAACCNLPAQVVLSGSSHHAPPEAAAAAAGTVVGLGPGGTAVLNAPGQAHPLRPYWEYLSYLFRCGAAARSFACALPNLAPSLWCLHIPQSWQRSKCARDAH